MLNSFSPFFLRPPPANKTDDNEDKDFKTSPPHKPEEENFKPPPSDPGLNFQLPADLDASNFSSNVSGGAHGPSPGGSGNRVRSVSWSSLEELSTVKPGKHVYILVFGAGSGSEVRRCRLTPPSG